MAFFRYRSWERVIFFQKLAGFWPYQRKAYHYFMFITFFLIALSNYFVQVARMIKEWGTNFHIVVENIVELMLAISFLIKVFASFTFPNNRKKVYDTVFKYFETIRDPEETKALREHYDYGLRYWFIYTIIAMVAVAVFPCLPIAKMYFDHIFMGSELQKIVPIYVEYFVDEQEYFYLIMLHIVSSLAAGLLVSFAFDLSFIMEVQHICALFKIITIRLKNTSKNKIDCNKSKINTETHNSIKSAIDLHVEVLEMVNLIEKTYNLWLLALLVLNMIDFGTILFLCHSNMHDPLQLTRYTTYLVAILIHFHMIYSRGQMIIDSSSSVFDACYENTWYVENKSLRQTFSIVIARSLRPCQITGGKFFVISIQTYGKMLKAGYSYFNVCKTVDQ